MHIINPLSTVGADILLVFLLSPRLWSGHTFGFLAITTPHWSPKDITRSHTEHPEPDVYIGNFMCVCIYLVRIPSCLLDVLLSPHVTKFMKSYRELVLPTRPYCLLSYFRSLTSFKTLTKIVRGEDTSNVVVIPTQNRVTHQILNMCQPFKDLKQTFPVSLRAEQLLFRAQQRVVATVELGTRLTHRDGQTRVSRGGCPQTYPLI